MKHVPGVYCVGAGCYPEEHIPWSSQPIEEEMTPRVQVNMTLDPAIAAALARVAAKEGTTPSVYARGIVEAHVKRASKRSKAGGK